MIAILGGLADVERDLIRTRTAEGRSRAKARGQHMGRHPFSHLAAAGGSQPAPRGGRDVERPRPILQRQHGHDFEAQDMSAGFGPSCSLLSGSDPVEAIEQENGVPVDDALRPVNSSDGAFKSAPVHALGLCNVIADPAIGTELSA
jgi:hypothetical protein